VWTAKDFGKRIIICLIWLAESGPHENNADASIMKAGEERRTFAGDEH
jgi:hypothetical protein